MNYKKLGPVDSPTLASIANAVQILPIAGNVRGGGKQSAVGVVLVCLSKKFSQQHCRENH